MRRTLRHLRNRPSLFAALLAAAASAGIAGFWFRGPTALLIGWDVGVVVYVSLASRLMARSSVATIRQRARLLDPGKWAVLSATVLAALASLGAIVAELVSAKGTPDAGFSAVLAAATVLLSWAFIHFFFAQHYAHDYWLDGEGLEFPGNDAPDYQEFLYFSFTIGMTAQVSDVTTKSALMRRVVLMHGILSFIFNTAVLALGVNLAAGLVS